MVSKANKEDGHFTLDLRGVRTEAERGSAFSNSSLVEVKFSVKCSWIKSVRKAKDRPDY